MTFGHEGTEWTVTVGETIRGEAHHTKRVKGRKIEKITEVRDEAMVHRNFRRPYLLQGVD